MSKDSHKILFLVGTEYHMLVTLSAIADLYSDSKKYEITICQVNTDVKKRFRENVDLGLSHVEYVSIAINSNSEPTQQQFKNEINRLESYGYNTFIFFNEHSELGVYLVKALSAQGTHIILAPDGMKAYDNLTHFAPRWSLKFSMRYRKFVKKNKLNRKYNTIWPRLRYAYLKNTKEVWITNPDRFNNWNNKKVSKLEIMQTQDAISLINRFFMFDPLKEMKVREKVIFLICMPPKYEVIEQFNEELIQTLLQNFPDYTLMLKLHPATTPLQIERLKKLDRCILINSTNPAELFIAQLKDSIIISFWSASSLINNASCRFYWLFRIFEKNENLPGILKVQNPTSHIIEVNSISEIK